MTVKRFLSITLLRLVFDAELLVNAGDDPKRQVAVEEVVLDSAVSDVVYLGNNHECVLIVTKKKHLYFSEDGGQKWNDITSKVENANAQILAERLIVNPIDKSVAILQTMRKLHTSDSLPDGSVPVTSWHPYIYITEDSGRTWRKAWGRHHGLHSWIAHPTERSWALVSWWSGECGKEKEKNGVKDPDDDDEVANAGKPCVHRLMFTKDLGRNFLQLAEYVVQFSWGTKQSGQTNRVYYTAFKNKQGDQARLSRWSGEVDFNYIDFEPTGKPSGKPTLSLALGNKFLVSNEYILVAVAVNEAQQTVHLMVSKDGAKSFKAALLPSGMGELEEKWYTILDTSEGAVILHLNADSAGTKDTGRIFVSDSDGYKYSQSLLNNVRSSSGDVEFDKVVSMNGVYLANVAALPTNAAAQQTISEAKQDASESVEKEAAEGSEVDRKHGRGGNAGQNGKASKEERSIRTVISLDKGGSWSYLKPPKVNSLGAQYVCQGRPLEECALHLHGTSSWDLYAPFYSTENAVGLIMGTGNVGADLRFEPEETNTYLSRDGGLTWVEAHKGAFIYEFGDHGGLIVMADDLKKTSEVVFSWNEGESWYDFKVSQTPFEVDNIISEPNLTSTTFLMFGTREEGVGVLYYLKFDALQFPACKGVWAADSVSSDYETWTPSNSATGDKKCLLGQQVTYTRRKRTSQCWNGENFERPTVQKACSCTQADFACDVGFIRSVGSTECVFGGVDMMPERFAPTLCQDNYAASAYQKVPGDMCEGGWTPLPIEVPCPGRSLFRRSFFKLLLCGAFVAGAAFLFSNSGLGRGKSSTGFGEFSSQSRLGNLSQLLVAVPTACCGLIGSLMSRSRSYQNRGYQPVKADESYDMDLAAETLNDFLDEADYDDHAPPRYTSLDEKLSRATPNGPRIIGGARAATETVPTLQAPPGKGPQTFDMAQDDEDLL